MITTNGTNKSQLAAKILKLASGMQEYLASKTFPLNGTVVKGSDVIKTLQQQLTLQAQAATAREAWQNATAAMQTQYTDDIKDLIPEIEKYVGTVYGVGSIEYLAMGFAVPKKRQASAATRAQAVVQGQATRKARGTLGKKERLAIKGVVQPAAAPAGSTSPAPSPVVAAPSAGNAGSGASH
jgi:hypothetical protein